MLLTINVQFWGIFLRVHFPINTTTSHPYFLHQTKGKCHCVLHSVEGGGKDAQGMMGGVVLAFQLGTNETFSVLFNQCCLEKKEFVDDITFVGASSVLAPARQRRAVSALLDPCVTPPLCFSVCLFWKQRWPSIPFFICWAAVLNVFRIFLCFAIIIISFCIS